MNEKKRTIRGEDHSLIILKVTSSDEHGRPKTADIGYDETTFNLKGGEEFITAWVPTKVIQKSVS